MGTDWSEEQVDIYDNDNVQKSKHSRRRRILFVERKERIDWKLLLTANGEDVSDGGNELGQQYKLCGWPIAELIT